MSSAPSIEHYVKSYGDLIFDLCDSVLWSTNSAHIAFRAILKDIRRSFKSNPYAEHERAWVLKIASDRLRSLSPRHGRRETLVERIKHDANPDLSGRLRDFESYFHRLSTEEQILLTLRDKYQVPYSEIASVLGIPEESLKMSRQQAIRTLEEWIWENQ